MDPKAAQSLMKSRAFKKFLQFALKEMEDLNSVDDIEVKDKELIAIEVTARKLGRDKLRNIFKPFIKVNKDNEVEFNRNEYAA